MEWHTSNSLWAGIYELVCSISTLDSYNFSIFLVFALNNAPVGLWSLLVYVSFPICFLKQLVNVVQLMIASKDVVAYDMAERRKSKS